MLPLETLTGGLAMLVLIIYAVLGGADFGGGVWDALARGPRAKQQRAAIAEAMGPVWEANHVWLIFLIVILFTAFPPAFAALSVALFIPLHLALAGIILRGASFVFRAHGASAVRAERAWGSIFGSASIITPVLLGMCLGAISTGQIRMVGGIVTAGYISPWLALFPIMCGAFALALCAYLAAIYLILETRGEVREDFRRRALASGGVVAILAMLMLPITALEAPRLWSNLITLQDAPVLAAGAGLALLSGWAVWTRRYRLGRIAAAGEVVILLLGWALAQWPYIIYPDMSLASSAAPAPTLQFLLATLPLGALLLVPALWLLFSVFKGHNPAAEIESKV